MIISRIKLTNWKNFADAEAHLGDVNYIVGANASGKSNFLDVFRFLRDIAKPIGGGLQAAVANRGGFQNICSLSAEKESSVKIEIDVANSGDEFKPVWKYVVEIGMLDKQGIQNPIILNESVHIIKFDGTDDELLLANSSELINPYFQTILEQEWYNTKFKDLVRFFSNITYLNAVPQLIKFNAEIGGRSLENDPFGQNFLQRLANTPVEKRLLYLKKIQSILKQIIPNIENVYFSLDTIGRPHLNMRCNNHRKMNMLMGSMPQTEEQFSDGTLRLIALFWQLLDGDNTLLLEEPELSLDEDVIRELPRMIDELNRTDDENKAKRQIIISTHSSAMLENKGINARYVLRLEAGENGTKIYPPSKEDEQLIMSGFSAAEAILPKVHPKNARNMSMT